MNSYRVLISGKPGPGSNRFEIRGSDLLDAVKRNFDSMIRKAIYGHVPYRYPITVTPQYKTGIIGGQGGVELHLEWTYSDHIGKKGNVISEKIWIEAEENDLNDNTTFVMEGN